MANDAPGKTASNSDSTENTSLSNSGDQQKVPPLRIVLNSAGNQKSSATTTGSQQPTKKERAQDNQLKTGGRVRIKLGTNRQQSGKGTNSDAIEASNKSENQKSKEKPIEKQVENVNEDSTSSFTHLRRITRRSQRTVQSISNEDEESISSMTSVDENLNAANSIQPTSDTNNELDQSNPAATASSATVNNATNGLSNADTPRRYKRKKVESSESQSIECDSLLGAQNYKLPNQNSFELFKNIRKQVDKKLKSLTCVQPKTPIGFRDYMLSRGSYLLDGNKLGNGTNLFMNEHGGLNTAPPGKYHHIRQNRVNYSVPNRAKVPLGLPVNSPLYDLFIEQEKERYRMRIQHIKEREKLTLAAEQEFMRAYNHAALAATNQTETFSVCTMLKHQEMYNYLDSDGSTILSREDAQQDQVNQPDGVRTRRRQHGQTSPAPARKGSNVDTSGMTQDNSEKKSDNNFTSEIQEEKKSEVSQSTKANRNDQDGSAEKCCDKDLTSESSTDKTNSDFKETQPENSKHSKPDATNDNKASEGNSTAHEKSEMAEVKMEFSSSEHKNEGQTDKVPSYDAIQLEQDDANQQKTSERSKTNPTGDDADETLVLSQYDNKANKSIDKNTDAQKKAIDRETFLIHLQEIDDKWDRIRREMLIRHKNEAESLHAIQKLEWEWKTKEIGACDVRTTPLINNTLVPKLDIFSQDY